MSKVDAMKNEVKIAEQQDITQEAPKTVSKPDPLRYQRDRDRELVSGIFRFYEVPGGSMSFCFKMYKQDPVERFDFIDGETYKIPLGVAKHLNKNGWYPLHAHALDEHGKPMMKIGQKVRRFGFQSLEFIDIEDLTIGDKQIVTVEHIIS